MSTSNLKVLQISDEIQKRQFELLDWFNDFCQQKNILYSVVGPLAIDFVRTRSVSKSYYDIRVVVLPKDREKIISFSKDLPSHIELCGSFNYPYFRSRDLWLVDKESLFINPLFPTDHPSGIRICIVPLYPVTPPESIWTWTDRKLLTRLTKLRNYLSRKSPFVKRVARPVIKIKHYFENKDWQRVQDLQETGTHELWGRHIRSVRSNFIFSQSSFIEKTNFVEHEIDGFKFKIFKNLHEQPYSVVPKFDQVRVSSAPLKKYIINTSLSYEEFFSVQTRKEIRSLFKHHLKQQRYLHKIKAVESSYYSQNQAGLRVSYSLNKKKLEHLLQNGHLLETLRVKTEPAAIVKILSPYHLLFEYYMQRGLLLSRNPTFIKAVLLLWETAERKTLIEDLEFLLNTDDR